jgi:AcrR family transcriptional regulator
MARDTALGDAHVPGYRDAEMVRTPWGNAAELRSKRMRPGRGNAPEESERSQRERLFAALVAISSEKGYEATRIADLVQLAGVSRGAFYEHFEDKQACLLAAVDALLEPTIELIERAEDAPGGEARIRQAVEAFLGLVAAQPSASKMVFIEVYAAGPDGEAEIERMLDTFERFALAELKQIPDRKGMPPQMVRAMLGGFQKVIQKRLYNDEADVLSRLAEGIADWGLSYVPPPGPLEAPRRRGRRPRPFEERQAVAHPPERVLRALAALVAEKGYQATTVAEVVKRAGTSQRVFYGHFGRGHLFAKVFVPNQPPFAVHAHLTVFNGRTEAGRHAVLVHAYSTSPPVSFVIPFSVHHRSGAFRTVLVALIRRSAGPWPHVANFEIHVGRRFRHRGQTHSYLSASCPVPTGFTEAFLSFARATYTFAGGDQATIETVRSCQART